MMMEVVSSSKKRKKAAKYYTLHRFLGPDSMFSPQGAVRENIHEFLEKLGNLEEYYVKGMRVWSIHLVLDRGMYFPLYTIEECVTNSLQPPVCDHCRYAGWGDNFVSKFTYRFIIPPFYEWDKPLNDGALASKNHILHGVIHCNGFGHLLSINGIEGGSKCVCGREVMDLWDRICTALRSRKISLVDTSKKGKMDLRLLYGVAYGETWIQKFWNYKFEHGVFGVTKVTYEESLKYLRALELLQLQHSVVNEIISRYRTMTGDGLHTLGELFKHMLDVRLQIPIQEEYPPKEIMTMVEELENRWERNDIIEGVTEAISILKGHRMVHGKKKMKLKKIIKKTNHRFSKDLMLNLMAQLQNVRVNDVVVQRVFSPISNDWEFSLRDITKNLARLDIEKDIESLYQHVLMDSDTEMVQSAVRTVLDGKHFIKEGRDHDAADILTLWLICHVDPLDSADPKLRTRMEKSVHEHLYIRVYNTIGELKTAAENAMRDTYCMMQNLKVESILGMESRNDDDVLDESIQSGSEIIVKGSGFNGITASNYEAGVNCWVVNCKCGATEDDGERMVVCSVCDALQHTRCCEIEDHETVPQLFMCCGCRNSMVSL